MNKVQLLITGIESHDTVILGNKGTAHFPVNVSTQQGDNLLVMASENLLRKAGISTSELDDLVGSHLVAHDQVSLDGVVTDAEDRLLPVLDGTRPFLILSAANGSVKKSDFFIAQKREDANKQRAALQIAREEKREFEKKKAAVDRLLAKRAEQAAQANLKPETQDEPPVAAPQAEPQAAPSLETNTEDAPF